MANLGFMDRIIRRNVTVLHKILILFQICFATSVAVLRTNLKKKKSIVEELSATALPTLVNNNALLHSPTKLVKNMTIGSPEKLVLMLDNTFAWRKHMLEVLGWGELRGSSASFG